MGVRFEQVRDVPSRGVPHNVSAHAYMYRLYYYTIYYCYKLVLGYINTRDVTYRPVGSHTMSVHMKCSSSPRISKSSALKKRS
jgi:hypothetical protein